MRQLELLAASDHADEHPHKATIVATRTDGDRFTVIYRQLRSPQLLGRRGDAAKFCEKFTPRRPPARLAAILLQALSEPEDPGRPGPLSWAEGMVADPTSVRWLHSLD